MRTSGGKRSNNSGSSTPPMFSLTVNTVGCQPFSAKYFVKLVFR